MQIKLLAGNECQIGIHLQTEYSAKVMYGVYIYMRVTTINDYNYKWKGIVYSNVNLTYCENSFITVSWDGFHISFCFLILLYNVCLIPNNIFIVYEWI